MSEGQDRQVGDLPDPNDLPCSACGHVWFAGERQHGYVDRDDDVVVLCHLCFRQRTLSPAVRRDDDEL